MRNVVASIRHRWVVPRDPGKPLDDILSLYARERFLFRLGESPHRDRLVLKGATAFALWLNKVHRTTRDLDFLGIGAIDAREAERLVRKICAHEVVDDGVTFEASSVEAESIADGDEYHGVRVHLDAKLGSSRIRLQLDIDLGDVITPSARLKTLPTILDGLPPPRLKVYPPETIVAEKLHAIVKLGIANTRMKDFFDLYALASERVFDGALLTEAISKTFRRRKTPLPTDEPTGLTPQFFDDAAKQTQWGAFLQKTGADAPEDFASGGEVLRRFFVPLLKAWVTEGSLAAEWRDGSWREFHVAALTPEPHRPPSHAV